MLPRLDPPKQPRRIFPGSRYRSLIESLGDDAATETYRSTRPKKRRPKNTDAWKLHRVEMVEKEHGQHVRQICADYGLTLEELRQQPLFSADPSNAKKQCLYDVVLALTRLGVSRKDLTKYTRRSSYTINAIVAGTSPCRSKSTSS